YNIVANKGGAVLNFGSGQITTIGDNGSNAGDLYIDGANAAVESGGAAGNSALTSLGTIADNGQLDLRDGASVTTSGGLAVAGGGSGRLAVDALGGQGGSSVTINGNLVNASSGPFSEGGVAIGNTGMSTADLVTVHGTLDNLAGAILDATGSSSNAAAQGWIAVNGPVVNAGTVNLETNGLITVGAGNAYAQTGGQTNITGTLTAPTVNDNGGIIQGTGTINGDVVNAGTLAGGFFTATQPGTLTINGGLTNATAGTVQTLIEGTGAGQTSVVNIASGALALRGGTLNATPNGLTLAPGETFTVATFAPGSLTGLFSTLASGSASGDGVTLDLGNGSTLDAIYNNNSGNVELAVVATPATTSDTWTGGAGTWSTAGQWNHGVPLSYSETTIGATSSGDVTLNQDATVDSLTINSGNTLAYQSGAPASLTVGKTVTVNSGGALALGTSGDTLAAGGAINNAGSVTIGNGASVLSLASITNQAGGTVQLAGGSLSAPSYSNAGTTAGFGTVAPAIANTGLVQASGGTLIAQNGIQGSGAVTVNSGATLNLSQAATGSSAGTLQNNGALDLGSQNITVSADYNNANFGTGNSFNARANVAGTGQILASGNVALSVTGTDVSGGTSPTPTLALGNVHVGSTTNTNFSINNTGTTGPSLRGAVQNTGITNGAVTVTAANFGPVATGGSQTESLAYNPTVAGALSGQSFDVVSNFDNVAGKTVSVTGAAYDYANPVVNNSQPINLGNFHVGSAPTSAALSISNSVVSNAAYQEGLDANVAGTSGSAISNNGTTSLIAAGSTDNSAITVGVNGNTAGVETGHVTLGLVSNGSGTSGLGTTSLPQQSVTVTGTGYNLAQSNAIGPINLGVLHVGSGIVSQGITVANVGPTGSYTEGLDSSFGTYANSGGSLTPTFSGSIANLAAGSSDSTSMQVAINTATAGSVSGNIEILQDSNGTIDGLGNTTLPSQNPPVSGTVEATITNLAQPQINNAPVNFGNVRIGAAVPTTGLSVTNAAPVGPFTEGLIGNVTGATGGATASGGFGSPGNALAPGQTNSTGIQIGVNTTTAGHINGSAAVDFGSDGTSFGGTVTDLGITDVAVTGNVYRLASGSAPGTVSLGAARVGGSLTGGIAVTNSASNDGYSEALDATISGTTPQVNSASGSVTGLAAGQTNASGLSVGLNTATAGHISGTATVAFESDGTGIDGGTPVSVGSQAVTVQGNVYTPAVPVVNTSSVNFGIVHVGQSVTPQAISVGNGAAVTALNDTLVGGFGTVSGPFSGSGTLAGVAAGQTDTSSLQVGLNTSAAGTFTGTANLDLASHDTELADLAVDTAPITMMATVNNYAVAALGQTSGDGTFSGGGSAYSLDFGTILLGSGSKSTDLFAENAATGPSDLLAGGFQILSGSGEFDLTGFNPFAGLGAGQQYANLGVSFSDLALGSFSEEIEMLPTGYNISGYSGALPYVTLTIDGTVASSAPVPEPGSLALLLTGLIGLVGVEFGRRSRKSRRG
ncbi:MAG: beta strand repeat-containing protein, partial [Acetobacteraceae bacterium]